MSKKRKEANLISFKLLLNYDGKLLTEISVLPLHKVNSVFSKADRKIIKTLIEQAELKLKPLHSYLQDEIQAL